MKPKQTKIFDTSSKQPIDDDKLKAYLAGKLDEEARFELEASLLVDSFESDAVEGLKALPNEDLNLSVQKLNKQLHKQIAKKQKRKRAQFSFPSFAIIAVIIILLLTILAYLVLHFSTQ